MPLAWPGIAVVLVAFSGLADPPAGEVVVRPEARPGPLDNPLKGWCPYTDAGPIHQPYGMVFQYVSWSDLETTEGVYDFDRWEATAWSVPSARDKHVVLRVYVDYPAKPSGLPSWLKAQGVRLTPYQAHGGGVAPDYDDPKVLAGLERLIVALGRRYDADPRVGFVELGLLGFWGEWHTWPIDALYASRATERRIILAYQRAFPTRKLMARTALNFAGEQSWLGFHDDMIPEDTDNGHDWSFLAGIRRAGRSANWKVAVIGGEMVPDQAKRWLGEGFEQTITMVQRSHLSWIGPYCPALEADDSPRFQERSAQLVRLMGYQFRLDEIRFPGRVATGDPIQVAIQGTNEGVAPFYYPWPVEVGLIDAEGKLAAHAPIAADVRTWLPGPFQVDAEARLTVPPGPYRVVLGIIDPRSNRPAIRFASQLPDSDGWVILGAVTLTQRDEGPAPIR